YLAPEVIEGQPSTAASDVHAWGATVAFAATGRPPFGTGPYEGIFYRIMNGQANLAGAPGTLLPLLAAALARDPAHRPPAVQLRAPPPRVPPRPRAGGPAPGHLRAAPGPGGAIPGSHPGGRGSRDEIGRAARARGGRAGGLPAARVCACGGRAGGLRAARACGE